MAMYQPRGLLKVRVMRGRNLAVRDIGTRTSDPYVKLRFGTQKLRTSVVKKNVNPEWNQELTLSIEDPTLPVKLEVFDKDTFTSDDPMGHAEFDIQPFIAAVKMGREGVPNNTIIHKVMPSRNNCLVEESNIYLHDGKIVQDIILKLKDVECGEIELQLLWVYSRNSRGT